MADGPIKASHKNPGQGENEARVVYNLAFQEVRKTVETAFSRVCMWFPILGNNKDKWNYSDEVLLLSVHAASRMHNWMMNTENLSYGAIESAEVLFAEHY